MVNKAKEYRLNAKSQRELDAQVQASHLREKAERDKLFISNMKKRQNTGACNKLCAD